MTKKKKKEHDFGYEYAEFMSSVCRLEPVDIEKRCGRPFSIPDEDYEAMSVLGIAAPSCQKYWRGFNDFIHEKAASASEKTE